MVDATAPRSSKSRHAYPTLTFGANVRRWPTGPGTYLLLLHRGAPAEVVIGRLGTFAFPAGRYVYVGSALGGLGARLRRHARRDKPRRWHVDYLRVAAGLVAVAYRLGPERIECSVAARVAALPGAEVTVPRFGASDCRCAAHLFRFARSPDLRLGPGWALLPIGQADCDAADMRAGTRSARRLP